MEVLYLLIPMSVALIFGVAALLVWAVEGEQFDELESIGAQVLDLRPSSPPDESTCELRSHLV
ncbi:MAG TPA: cbb3-type cytochrome oxidase assembly protein [Burkholderiaceae bacterium]|nr:cbb3-type cytochrome oxidase assembly protein [Burkholderiaceae bacterium]